jgi:predicted transcriptional regulator
MTTKNDKKRLNVVAIRVDDEMLAELRELAEKQHRPLANFIVAVLKDHLAVQKKG